MPDLVPSDQAVSEVPCDALVCGAFSGDGSPELSSSAQQLDNALDGYLSEHVADTAFRGKASEVLVVPTHRKLPAKRIVLVGLGDRDEVGALVVRRAAAAAVKTSKEARVIASCLHEEVEGSAAGTVEGFLLGSHKGPSYKKDKKPSKIERIEFLGANATDVDRGSAYAEATTRARDLVNEPASVLTPDVFAARARDLADSSGLETTIFEEEELRSRGFGGLLAVASGSDVPPRLIHLRYSPEGATRRIALVGKGVTFDSGGLSLKDARGMETMKTDMGGGAAVIGAMSVLSRLNPTVQVDAYVPTTENMPGPSALRPGDVIHHYGGRTTEVLNTDAEGRLILGDALAYAAEQKPDVIVYVATLTGAMTVALGRKITGVFATTDDLWNQIDTASKSVGEMMWRMPLFDEYAKSLDSDVADAQNIGARFGGAVVAALYLRAFVPKDIPWAHLDIAGPGRIETSDELNAKGGTGVATRTLLAWLEGKA